jgi:glucosylceramidase
MLMSCQERSQMLDATVYETSAAGHQLTELPPSESDKSELTLEVLPEEEYQTITGFGGAFTEASAHLLNKLSRANRNKILKAYFSEEGANYSLTRTHINSCDFSLSNYSYAPVEKVDNLDNFYIEEYKNDLIPMIKDAMAVSENGFKILASPWTAPPWMKDNNDWVGGKLLPKYNDTWALFFSKYIDAYKKEGIDIWGLTVINEPLGNGNNWESMHFTPEEMTDFVVNHLGPQLEADGKGDIVVLGYDQNRGDLEEWVDEMFRDETSRKYIDGTAIHWYESTYDYFPEELQYAHRKAPDKYLIQTEACVDAEVPKWKDDAWYWSKEATDWGWEWAAEDKKYLHPKYAPVFRYARDIIGCLNNWVDGWVDWNMVLDRQGGPNWFENWCVAPIIVDPEQDKVYMTPIYYTLAHFSKFIRPKAKIIGTTSSAPTDLMVTAAKNPDGSIVLVVFNETEKLHHYTVKFGDEKRSIKLDAKAIQTVIIPNKIKQTS